MLFLLLVALLTGWVRCWNWDRVFRDGEVYFADADCYSRMARVQAVVADPGLIVREHGFENYPEGAKPHTTVPLDYLAACLAWALKPFISQYLDVAGAFVSPLLGIMTAVFMFCWARAANLSPWAILLLFAVSPVIVHGTALGRPDHQSLLLLCMCVALGAEWMMAQSRRWSFMAGAGWGLGLWVSLYEPAVLLATAQLLGVVFLGKRFFNRERLWSWVTLLSVLSVALLLEGWRLQPPQGELFDRWSATIGEMASSPSLLLRWSGWWLLLAPVLLCMRKQTVPVFLLLLAAAALTLQHSRWGYFFALIFAMSLPLQMRLVRPQWLAWVLLSASLWPVAQEWENTLSANSSVRTLEERQLRGLAMKMPGTSGGSILAPWWISPALSYWSDLPAVAGSSHQSLPGIGDSARFFIESDPARAHGLLVKRKVQWVVAMDSGMVLENSSAILGIQSGRASMAEILFDTPSMAPGFLRLEYGNQFFKAYRTREHE